MANVSKIDLIFAENRSQLLPVFLHSLQQRQLGPQLPGTAVESINDMQQKMATATALLSANKDLTIGLVSLRFFFSQNFKHLMLNELRSVKPFIIFNGIRFLMFLIKYTQCNLNCLSQ